MICNRKYRIFENTEITQFDKPKRFSRQSGNLAGFSEECATKQVFRKYCTV